MLKGKERKKYEEVNPPKAVPFNMFKFRAVERKSLERKLLK